jgi:hypothetical protein
MVKFRSGTVIAQGKEPSMKTLSDISHCRPTLGQTCRGPARFALTFILTSGCSPAATDTAPESAATESAGTTTSTSFESALKHWRKTMSMAKAPKDGCFKATHPSTTWEEVPCVVPPDVPFEPSTAGGARSATTPQNVGDTSDDFAARVSTLIYWAEGSFPLTVGVTNASDSSYSLQINSNGFYYTNPTSSPCRGAKRPSLCFGWQQFIYARTSGGASAFIQYWLRGYENACPSNWTSNGQGSCYRNSPSAIPMPRVAPADLDRIAMIASADPSGAGDSVTLANGVDRNMYLYGTSNVLDLYNYWNKAEFNIFGNGNKSQFHFNSGSSLIVQVLTDSGAPTSAPFCDTWSGTAETNSLNLVPKSCCLLGGNTPGIQFLESNVSPLPAPQACPLMPVDPNWFLGGHPFDRLIGGTDTDGTPIHPCRAQYQGGLHVGKTRNDSEYCTIGWGGTAVFVKPYETLVGAWSDASFGSVPSNAMPFGYDGPGGPTLYACRAFLGTSGFQLGKVRPGLGACKIPANGKENTVYDYQVLTNSLPLVTQSINGARPPAQALLAGYDNDNTPLYVCQAPYNGGLHPGKTRPEWANCLISYSGKEVHLASYSVLVPSFKTGGTPFKAGNDAAFGPLGVCQASYQGSTQVGKYFLNSGMCNFVGSGAEQSVSSNFTILAF